MGGRRFYKCNQWEEGGFTNVTSGRKGGFTNVTSGRKGVLQMKLVGGRERLPVHNDHAWSAKNNVEIHSVDSDAGIVPRIYSFIKKNN